MNTQFAVDEIKSLIDDIEQAVHKYGDLCNPRYVRNDGSVSGTCVYESTEAQEGNHMRCVVGEIAHLRGWNMPAYDDTNSVRTVAENYAWPISEAAASFLSSVQIEFDYVDSDTGQGRTWGDAWNKFKAENQRYFVER